MIFFLVFSVFCFFSSLFFFCDRVRALCPPVAKALLLPHLPLATSCLFAFYVLQGESASFCRFFVTLKKSPPNPPTHTTHPPPSRPAIGEPFSSRPEFPGGTIFHCC